MFTTKPATDMNAEWREFTGPCHYPDILDCRLVAEFPAIAERLISTAEVTEIMWHMVATSSRHVLTAEALVDVLEKRILEGRGVAQTFEGEIVGEYHDTLKDKLLTCHGRTDVERITRAYPEVDFESIAEGLKQGVISKCDASTALEESVHRLEIMDEVRAAKPKLA